MPFLLLLLLLLVFLYVDFFDGLRAEDGLEDGEFAEGAVGVEELMIGVPIDLLSFENDGITRYEGQLVGRESNHLLVLLPLLAQPGPFSLGSLFGVFGV